MPWDVVTLIGVTVCAGAFVQAVVGLGIGLVSAPVIALAAPQLMPALPLWLALMMSGSMVLGERHHVDWRALAWALPARVPGTVLGAWLVLRFTGRSLGLAVAVMVLAAVAASWRSVHVRVTPTTLVLAGVAAGASGTATSIGGPPIALLFQRQEPEVVRATLSVFFFGGVILSLTGLAVSGSLPSGSWHLALLLAPLVGGGMLLGSSARRRIPRERFRLAVLAVCALSALALLIRSL